MQTVKEGGRSARARPVSGASVGAAGLGARWAQPAGRGHPPAAAVSTARAKEVLPIAAGSATSSKM